MTEIDYKYRSEKLKRDVSLKILIPQDFNPKTCKIIYLLHGYLEDNSCWIEKGLAKEVSENKNIAMIMPSLENSFAINYIDGFDYFSYLAYELLDEVLLRFSWDKKSLGQDPLLYIAGLSMGGYSALKIGLRRNIFKGIGSFSGLTDAFVTKENFDPEFPRMCVNNLVVEEDDLFYLANSLQTKLPSVYLYCGTSDSLYSMNVEYAKIISKKTKKFKFDTDERGHVWPAWRDALVAFINFID